MTRISKKRLGAALFTLALGATGFVCFSFWRAARTLQQEGAKLTRENQVQFTVSPLSTAVSTE